MTRRPARQNLVPRHSVSGKMGAGGYRQPFWLPALSFYLLTSAIAVIFFFVSLVLLQDGEELPWVPAMILASCIVGAGVILREVVLRKRRYDLLIAQERLDFNLKNIHRQKQNLPDENKLTLEKNAAILQEITKKSEAAKVLGRLPEVHWEVFELCEEYLHRSEKELETVAAGSPRLPALNRGREKVQSLHKFHLLAWSSVESRSLIQEAEASVTISKKLEIATKALNILDSAIQFYPGEQKLTESSQAVKEFISTIKVSHWIEQAERSAFKGNVQRALSHYRDALFYLARENERSSERDLIAERINLEIAKLKQVSSEKQKINPLEE